MCDTSIVSRHAQPREQAEWQDCPNWKLAYCALRGLQYGQMLAMRSENTHQHLATREHNTSTNTHIHRQRHVLSHLLEAAEPTGCPLVPVKGAAKDLSIYLSIYLSLYIVYISIYVCIHIYIYIYIYTCVYLSLSIYIYIISPPNKKPPLIRNPPLGGTNICYYQFRRRHDYPPHKKRFWVRSTPLIRNPP